MASPSRLGSSEFPRGRLTLQTTVQRERHKTKGLMSRVMAACARAF